VSSRIRLDDSYRSFFELVAGQLDASLAAARASEADRRRAEALAELDRAKTAFFSNVSHEFRTPLTLILGPLEEVMSAGDLPPSAQRGLEVVQRNAQRLLRLVNTLLDFARIEAGRAQASYQAVDLAGFTADLASNFRSACERAGLALEVDCAPLDEPAWVDREMWEKIVLNLVSNAFKFTLEGAIHVSLRAHKDFVLEVRDTGTGIPAHELPRMFERFHRVEGARGRSHEGSGIGLALVHELVKLHGGSIAVESEAGRGSVFTVRIPRGSAHLPAESMKPPREGASTALRAGAYVSEALSWLPGSQVADTPSKTGQRVLVVDDNADMRTYAARLLSANYEVATASDGYAALAAARARRPDIVVADVMMPGLDGFGLLRELRADPALRSVPVLLLSARAGEEARVEGLGRGADDYLVKPFSASELLVRVRALLQSSEIRREALETERRAAEQFRALLEQAPLGMYLVDADFRIREANPVALSAFGNIPGGVIGRDFGEIIRLLWDKDYADEIVRVFRRTLQTGEPYVMPERAERRADRAVTEYYEWRVDRIPLPDGRDGVVCYFRDISAQVHARKALERSEEALREADRRKDEFIATLSHELRNPLAPLANALEILRLGPGGDEPPVVAMMERQLKQLVRLTDDLLEMSRITRGSFELRRERTALAGIVRTAVETAEPLIRAAHHSLTVSPSPEELWVDGDPVRLAQIVGNLLSNAAKYTEDGGRIELQVRRDGAQALVSVRDNGAGLAPQDVARVFDMFVRGARSTGLGIGLALARSLAQMHGGMIEAASAGPGKGAEFTLRLPLAAAPEAAAERAQQGWSAMTQKRVLVVDDNRDAADSLGTLLEHLGAEVRVVHDARQALAAFEAYRPGVVLLDLGMPDLDGYQVARAIRARERDGRVPLVALTGWGQEEDRRRVREAGFDHHLVKPADLGALRALFGSL
jgi:PAS domain S-box-containing protein